MKNRQALSVVALAALLTLGLNVQASTTTAGASDLQIQSNVQQQLAKKSEFKNVQSTVSNGVITLTGSVDTFKQKLDAANKARKADKDAKEIRNLIDVAGASVPDEQLQKKISRSISYDRVGYFDNAFDVIQVSVKDGVVTLNGAVPWGPAREGAVAIAANTKGIKGVVDNIRMLPASTYDDDLRVRLFGAIYGDNVLGKYAVDPAKPIRILVDHGQVGLYGEVMNKMDKEVAGIRASGVFGGFTVENHLTTPNQGVDR